MRNKWSMALGISILTGAVAAGVFYPEGATTLHFAFEGSPNGDRPVIRPPAFYAEETGFGFVDSPTLIGNANGVQAPKYFRFDAKLPPGNYDVTVRVGSPQAASRTTIRAEGHRPMVFDVATAARASSNVSFTVNVRAADAAHPSLDADGRLTLEFAGENPSMMKLDIKPNTTAPTLYILSDGRAMDADQPPRTGWGQMLPLFFKSGEVAVANWSGEHEFGSMAVAGAALSRADSNSRPPLAEALKPGDYVLIAVGNDSPLHVLPPREKFEAGLTTLVEAVRARKAIPLLADPAPALAADAKYDLAAAESWVHAVADKEKVQYLSVYPAADKWLNALGTANAASPFNVSSDPRAADLNHFSAYGAFEYAKLIALAIRDSKIELASHLYAEIPATNADPKQFPPALGYDYLKRE